MEMTYLAFCIINQYKQLRFNSKIKINDFIIFLMSIWKHINNFIYLHLFNFK